MEKNFYTINEVSELLGMHHKTIRKFITDGKLIANKVGKQWRISGHDLSIFLEKNALQGEDANVNKEKVIGYSTEDNIIEREPLKVNVSAVVDINAIDADEYNRISNMLLAVMNCKDEIMAKSTMNIKYSADEMRLRIMLWGSIKFIENMLGSVSALTDRDNQ